MTTTTTTYGFLKYSSGETPWSHSSGLDSIDGELARPRWPFNSPSVGATTTLDLSLARTFVFTVNQVTTIAITNPPSSSFTTRLVCLITNGSAFALTWPASVTWLSGIAPTLKTSGVDLVELVTRDGGTTWYGGALDRPLNRLAGQANTDVGTGASAAEVTLHTVTLPANIMGPNGALRVRIHYSVTGTNNTKAVTVYLGATQIGLTSHAAGDQVSFGLLDLTISNRGATNSQHIAYSFAKTSTAIQYNGGTTAIDTTAANNIVVKGQTVNSADEVTANVTLVELLRS